MHTPQPGDTYIIRRLTGALHAEITEVIGEGENARAVVRVPVHGALGEDLGAQLITVPVANLVPVERDGPDDRGAKFAS